MTLLIATLIALLLMGLLLGVNAWVDRLGDSRVFREMATFACPYCLRPMGLKAVAAGRDCSPFEELWDLQGVLVHCHPICRNVQCEHCSNCVVIRLNSEGEQFGSRLSAGNAEEIARIKAMAPDQIAEMKEWLTEHQNRQTGRK